VCVKSRTVAPRPAGDERDAARQPHLVSERKRADDAVPRPRHARRPGHIGADVGCLTALPAAPLRIAAFNSGWGLAP
jgi:hypothetical protein